MLQVFNRLGISVISILIGLILIQVFSPLIAKLETDYLPVVKDVKLSEVVTQETGIAFFASFNKVRQCEFVTLAWYDINGNRLKIAYKDVNMGKIEETRPLGKWNVGPWFLYGVNSLENINAYAYHKCHPFWITITKFFINK